MLTLTNLIDDAKCYETIREFRWPEGTCCPHCGSKEISKRGKDERQPSRQRYRCRGCDKQFDDRIFLSSQKGYSPYEVGYDKLSETNYSRRTENYLDQFFMKLQQITL
ncbi:MAG: transposase [Hormoscilla sp. SP12CHS1]|nr:transposase [Hormoscilla sp. SP12CHS1]